MGREQSPVEIHRMDEAIEAMDEWKIEDLLKEAVVLLRRIDTHLSQGSDIEYREHS
jgi:hypothetical protein